MTDTCRYSVGESPTVALEWDTTPGPAPLTATYSDRPVLELALDADAQHRTGAIWGILRDSFRVVPL